MKNHRAIETPTRRRGGFTLLEVVVTIAILATVLTVAYRILTNILETERLVSRLSTPEKVGVGILSMIQRDLLGVVYRDLGEHVFQVIDNGDLPMAQDEIQFFTTRNPIAPETLGGQLESGGGDLYSESFHSILGVIYTVQTNVASRTSGVFTLFRHEITEFDSADPFGNPGRKTVYEIYDKVRAFSVECFDGREWFILWDSQQRLLEEQQALEEQEAGGVGAIESVTATAGTAGQGAAAGAEDPTQTEPLLPPAAVPVAVRLTIVILAGDEKGAYTDEAGFGEFKEFTYSAVVPILPAIRVPLSSDEEIDALGALDDDPSGLLGGPGAEDGGPTGGGPGGGPSLGPGGPSSGGGRGGGTGR